MKRFSFFTLGVLLLAASGLAANAAAYYIDWSGGSDSNNGLTAAAPWKRHPYMAGWAGSYAHVPGDRYIFRGGITWPKSCFTMQVLNGGVAGLPDFYGTDTNWYYNPTAWATNGAPSTAIDTTSFNGEFLTAWFSSSGTNYFARFKPGSVSSLIPFSTSLDPNFLGINPGFSDVEYDGTNVWLSCRGRTNHFVFQYTLAGNSAAFVSLTQLGAADEVPRGMLRTTNGGLFVFRSWVPSPAPLTNTIRSAIAYRSPGGVWYETNFSFVTNPGQRFSPGTSYATAVHPVDGRVWNFFLFDQENSARAIAAQETGAAPIYTAYPDLIDRNVLGADGRDGEIPKLRAIADPVNNVIQLAYQRNFFTIFTNTPFRKGCYMGIASLDTNGVPAFRHFDEWVERTGTFGFWVNNGNPAFLYHSFGIAGEDPAIILAEYDGAAWNKTAFQPSASLNLGYARNRAGMIFKETVTGSWNVVVPAAQGVFANPVWDAQNQELPGGYDVMLLMSLANRPHDIEFNGLDFKGLHWSGNKAFSWVAYVNLSVSSNITLQSCTFRDWSHAPMPTTDQLKVVIGANSPPYNPGCLIQDCLFDGGTANSGVGSSSGEATYAYSGNISGSTVRNMASGFIVTGPPVPISPQIVSDCSITTLNSYDPGAHPDAIFMNGGNLFHWHDNYIANNWVENVFTGEGSGAEQVFLWNNVIYGCKTQPAIIANNNYAGARLWVWNNTIVSGSYPAVRIANRNTGPVGVLDFRNNLVISDSVMVSLDAGASIAAYTNANNVLLTTAAAFVQGYSEANLYQPTSAGTPTVGAGQDLSSLLSGALTSDILGVSRPQGSAWDAGAYEFLNPQVNPGVVSLSASAVNVSQNAGFVGITVVRSGGTAGAITATVATADGTALAGHDYSAVVETLTWLDGETGARSFTIPILASGDTATTNRTFTVNVTGTTGGPALGLVVETVTIVMNPPPPPVGVITMVTGAASVAQNGGSILIEVLRSGGSATAVTVNANTVDGTAIAGHDYTAVSTTLSWANGESGIKSFSVPILASGDTALTNRSFRVFLSTADPIPIGTPSFETVTILMNAPAVNNGVLALATASATVPQAAGSVTITVNRAAGTDGAVGVTASTINGSATAGIDYTATTQLLSWGAGVGGSQSFNVPIINSGITAATNRSFTVALSAVTGGAVIGAPSNELVTIIMLPPPPTNGGVFSFSASSYSTTLTSVVLTVTVLRTGSTNTAAAVSYATSNGSATAGIDYVATSGTLNWTANDNAAQTFQVPILNSGAAGPNRFFTLLLSNPTNGSTLGGPSAAMVSIQLNSAPGTTPGGVYKGKGHIKKKGPIRIGGR